MRRQRPHLQAHMAAAKPNTICTYSCTAQLVVTDKEVNVIWKIKCNLTRFKECTKWNKRVPVWNPKVGQSLLRSLAVDACHLARQLLQLWGLWKRLFITHLRILLTFCRYSQSALLFAAQNGNVEDDNCVNSGVIFSWELTVALWGH